VREIVERPYRIIYRLAREDEIQILTVHHAAKQMRDTL
jgi:plasmid stabilization system protein ParE